MEDHVWLIDLQKVFDGQRYILRVAPSSSANEETDEVVNQVVETRQSLHKRIEKMHNALNKSIDMNDQNTRFQLGNQYSLSAFTLSKIRDVDQRLREAIQAARDEQQNLTKEDKMAQLQLQAKKEQFYTLLNQQIGNINLSRDQLKQIAFDWMEAIDSDKSGRVEYEEFYEFFQKIDGVAFSDLEIRSMFDEFDRSGDGGIDTEEFARILANSLIPEGRDGATSDRQSARLEAADLIQQRVSARGPDPAEEGDGEEY